MYFRECVSLSPLRLFIEGMYRVMSLCNVWNKSISRLAALKYHQDMRTMSAKETSALLNFKLEMELNLSVNIIYHVLIISSVFHWVKLLDVLACQKVKISFMQTNCGLLFVLTSITMEDFSHLTLYSLNFSSSLYVLGRVRKRPHLLE